MTAARPYQVEYAMEAIGNAGSAIGLLSKDGVILIGEKKVTSKLLQTSASPEKMYKIDDHVACAVAGIMSDANILINTARVQAQRYTLAYQEPMPVEQLVQSPCDTKQGYTQFGGLRPFGVSFLFAGWAKDYGFQLYMSDPSGNYSGWKAAAIGANNQAAQSMLKQDNKDEITREEAIELALKVLSKTMDSTSLTSEKFELAEVFVCNGKVKYQVCSPEALSKLLRKSGVRQPAGSPALTDEPANSIHAHGESRGDSFMARISAGESSTLVGKQLLSAPHERLCCPTTSCSAACWAAWRISSGPFPAGLGRRLARPGKLSRAREPLRWNAAAS